MFENDSEKVLIIAEMANAHEGSVKAARKIIEAAKNSGADAIKFQVFTPDELAVPNFTNYDLYKKLQMPRESWADLVDYGKELDLQVMADVFGIESAEMMNDLGVDVFKIHSADLSNVELQKYLGNTDLPILLSIGGSTWIEVKEALNTLKFSGGKSIILMHGIQSYPTLLSDSNLRRIEVLRAKFGIPVGFASHLSGDSPEALTLPALAVAGGADLVEVHITLDRSKKGLDYYSSLEPAQFVEMVEFLRAIEPILGKRSMSLTTNEMEYRFAHKKWAVSTRVISSGERLSAKDLSLKRVNAPPSGQPLSLDMIIGHQIQKAVKPHSVIQSEDLRMKVAAVLACRAESSRLFGKPMQLVGDRPIIQHLIDQLRKVKGIDEIVLAISDSPSSQIFIKYAEREGLHYVVGPEKDVLLRLIQGADLVQADIILRTTTENPFIYWENIDDLISDHIKNNADLTVTEKLPLGSFVEIISLNALKRSHKFGEDRHRSEYCTLFISENPDNFTIQRITPSMKLQRPDIRLTVDTPHDLILVRALWESLSKDGELVTLEKIIEFLDANPELLRINNGEQTLYLWK